MQGMQESDGTIRFSGSGGADDPDDDSRLEEDDESSIGAGGIRELQRRRRDATRRKYDMEAILALPQEDEEEDEEDIPLESESATAPSAPAPARVYVVFRGTRWTDPGGSLRESDSLAGVYATEAAARKAVYEINQAGKNQPEHEDAWYQPYNVEP